MQCSRTFHTLRIICLQIFSSIAQKLLKIASPSKKLFHPKSVFSNKSCTPKNGSSPKIVSSRKKSADPEKMFHLKNVTNPKMFLRECNIYVKIPNFLTSENFGKFLRSKSICSFLSFPVSQNVLLIRIQKKFKRPTFQEGKQFFRIRKLWEIFGKFLKMQCSRTFHTLGKVCVQISARLLKNSSEMRLPQKNQFTQKVSLPKKVLPRKMGVPRKLCLH